MLPKGGPWGFFGWHLVKSHHKAIIVTEGENRLVVTVVVVVVITIVDVAIDVVIAVAVCDGVVTVVLV